ncbi:ABC transporter substrate-binding protein [Falsirhodobacter sp. 1013]|uniref:ABC transporter substrate-binding protein n=1 Tax=Falsirhodobacter sp. 1013 TaxID=3417566 RepID=UPI003EB90124
MFKTTDNGLFMLNRRQLLAGASAGTAMLAAPSILRANTLETLTVSSSGGALEEAYRKAYFDTFEMQTGIKTLTAPYADTGRVKAMVDAGAVDIDVVALDSGEAAVLQRAGLLEELDFSVIDITGVPDWAHSSCYVLSDIAPTVIAWNTNSFSAESRPKNWAEFYDTEARPGQRGLWKYAMGTLESACLAAGVAPADLYPLDLDKAFAMLDKIKPDLTWWTSGAQSAQHLISNEVDLSMVWTGRVHQPKVDGAPVDYGFEQAVWMCDAWVIPKGAKNKDHAMRYIANVMQAKNQAIMAQNIPYGPTITAALDLLPPETQALMPNFGDNGKDAVVQNVGYWSEHGSEIFARFNEWLAG